jgi:hypothetical protein
MKTVAVISMLHESAERNSATRRFRGDPVLAWTLSRLARANEISEAAILCWDDQVDAVTPFADGKDIHLMSREKRRAIATMDAVTAAQRWADGWRGGLLQTCWFDLGFEASAYREVLAAFGADAIVQINASAGLIDPGLIDAAAIHSRNKPGQEIYFSPAAPGLGATLMTAAYVQRVARAGVHPGKLLHYLPDSPAPDPISCDACVPAPIPAMRTTLRFTLDSERQIERIERGTVSLNGQLISSPAEELVARLASAQMVDAMPREVRIELTTARMSRPIFSPAGRIEFTREAMNAKTAFAVLSELAGADDIRVTFAGVGDPLCYENLFDILAFARERGISAICVETDLLADSSAIKRLGQSGIDLVAVNLPAITQATYSTMMGVDGYAKVIENLRLFVAARGLGATPILVPVFAKCRENQGEMEAWYDHWLRALGNAVVEGPSDFAGQIADIAAADMTPPKRRACARLASRISVLSDGTIVACEQDVLGRNPLGRIGQETIASLWNGKMKLLRSDHQCGQWDRHALCGACREWHRP